eukprot:CAMPEP_0113879790 /NCGR_PEP_ID=MMETSP0780_2-20120614/7428_1 /TAXON_ID=652834 /ORGANISM="Palpitomonas bilix" /LENGTH=359 /DNA_ID=CAMNT_0000866399 /DNA_START=154 /DNA_END=1233 /DNA_ORIENTATION=- /assembly_acc=CAM_ASM_000599
MERKSSKNLLAKLDGAPSFDEVVDWIARHPRPKPLQLETLKPQMNKFILANEDPSSSPNFEESEQQDDMNGLVSCFQLLPYLSDDDVSVLALKMLRIVARKEVNRRAVDGEVVRAVLSILIKKGLDGKVGSTDPGVRPQARAIVCEAASCMLNICYEKENVMLFVQHGGTEVLCPLLASADEELVASVAGALQSVCYQAKGREALREAGVISFASPLLDAPSFKVRSRSVGVVHNMSSDPLAVPLIREADSLPSLVRLLKDPSPAVCGSAAGALQNISREDISRDIIKELGGVPPLTDLLFVSDVQTQVGAAGALLNILGPEMEENGPQSEARRNFKKLLTNCLVLGMSFHGLYTTEVE